MKRSKLCRSLLWLFMQLLCNTNSPALEANQTAFAEAGQTLIWRPIIPIAANHPTQTGLAEHKGASLNPVMQKADSSSISKVERKDERVSQSAALTKRQYDLRSIVPGNQYSEDPHSKVENGVSVEANVSEANVKQSDQNYKVIRMKRNWNDERWRDFIIRIANEYQVDPHLITAVIHSESNFNHQAISPKGALGLMQVMPQTAQRFGFKELFDPENNIRAGTAYLKWLLVRFNDDVILALAAYNAGENAVLRYKGVPPYKETQNYVAKVLRGYKKYEHVEHRLTTAQNQIISATKNLADTERIPKEGMKFMTDMVRVLEQAATLWVAPIK